MKTNIRLLSAILLLASACTTGSMVTSGNYSDDVYFTPGDHPPVIASNPSSNQQPAKRATTISGLRQEEAGKIVDNYLSDKKEGNLKSDNYSLNVDPADADTINESDDEARYLIDNYNDGDEIDYTTRIRTFYNPYVYDPYWDSYYSPGLGFNWGFGFGGFYGGLYSNWYNPYFGGWYDPWYSYGGWGGYYPYWGGYYGGGYWGGSYWGGGYGGGFDSHRDRYYGMQNHTGRGGSNAVRYSGYGGGASGSASMGIFSGNRRMSGNAGNGSSRTSNATINGGITSGGRQASGATGPVTTRQAGTRYTVDPNSTRSATIGTSTMSGSARSTETITNLRRGQTSGINSGTVKQGVTTGTSQRYTPSYSRPRTNIQSTYNSGTTRQYARPQSSGYSGNSSSRYSRPQGSSSTSGNTSVGSSYQRGSSRSSTTYSGPTGTTSRSSGVVSGSSSRSSSSGSSYSAPARSSYSGGGGGSSFSGGGGGSSSSGGGGGGRRH